MVSLTLGQSEYNVVEGDVSVEVCAYFSDADVIERSVFALLQTSLTDSTSGTIMFTHIDIFLLLHRSRYDRLHPSESSAHIQLQ